MYIAWHHNEHLLYSPLWVLLCQQVCVFSSGSSSKPMYINSCCKRLGIPALFFDALSGMFLTDFVWRDCCCDILVVSSVQPSRTPGWSKRGDQTWLSGREEGGRKGYKIQNSQLSSQAALSYISLVTTKRSKEFKCLDPPTIITTTKNSGQSTPSPSRALWSHTVSGGGGGGATP